MTQLTEANLLVTNFGNDLEFGSVINYDFGNVPHDSTSRRVGHEQGLERPAIIVSPSEFIEKTGFIWICPITREPKSHIPFIDQVPLPPNLNNTDGFVLLNQLISVKVPSDYIVGVRERIPTFARELSIKLVAKLPSSETIKDVPCTKPIIYHPRYRPDFGHIVSYEILSPLIDTNRHSPPLAFVITPFVFNKTTGFAWIFPIVRESIDGSIPLPDDSPYKGFVILDQLHSHDWQARNFRPVCKLPSAFTKDVLYVTNKILSSG